MAKKQTKQTANNNSNSNSTELVPQAIVSSEIQELINVNCTIDTNDISRIFVAEAELQLRALNKECKEKKIELEKALDEENEKQKKLITEEANAASQPVLSTMENAVESLREHSSEISNDVAYIVSEGRLTSERGDDGEYKKIILYTVSCNGGNMTMRLDTRVEPSADLLAVVAKIESLKEELQQNETKHFSVRKRLQDVASIERQVLAIISRHRLQHADGGPALLESIRNNFGSVMDLLGEG